MVPVPYPGGGGHCRGQHKRHEQYPVHASLPDRFRGAGRPEVRFLRPRGRRVAQLLQGTLHGRQAQHERNAGDGCGEHRGEQRQVACQLRASAGSDPCCRPQPATAHTGERTGSCHHGEEPCTGRCACGLQGHEQGLAEVQARTDVRARQCSGGRPEPAEQPDERVRALGK